jgi:hypothetical protein
MKRLAAVLTVPLLLAASLAAGAAPANAATVDGTCVASIALNFSPPVTGLVLPTPAPVTTSTGSGTITTCVFPGGGATTGTFSYDLTGNLTCVSAQNVTGTLTIARADDTSSTALSPAWCPAWAAPEARSA